MVIYERTKKVLVIPEGLDGGGHSGGDYERGVADGKAAQKLIDDNKITPTTAITENGSYTAPYGFKEVVVNVPTSGGGCNLQEKSVTLTAGTQTVTPDAGYDGITEADIDASELLSSRYSDGYSDGVDAIRNQFTSTAITRNGTYEMTGEFNAFSSVTVDVPKEIRLGTLVETPLPNDLTSSNRYIKQFDSGNTTDGWGTINLDMTQIIAYGKSQQRDLMSSTTITENGTYARTNGWNEVIVDVPTSGGTAPDVYGERTVLLNDVYTKLDFQSMGSMGSDAELEIGVYISNWTTDEQVLFYCADSANGTSIKITAYSDSNDPYAGNAHHIKLYLNNGVDPEKTSTTTTTNYSDNDFLIFVGQTRSISSHNYYFYVFNRKHMNFWNQSHLQNTEEFQINGDCYINYASDGSSYNPSLGTGVTYIKRHTSENYQLTNYILFDGTYRFKDIVGNTTYNTYDSATGDLNTNTLQSFYL